MTELATGRPSAPADRRSSGERTGGQTVGLLARPTAVSAQVLAEVAAAAERVDATPGDGRSALRALAADGVLDLGLPGSAGTYTDQARVLVDLAAACMTTAFSTWAHRMTVEYVVRHGGPALAELGDRLRRADRPGSTALAGTFRAAAGVAEIPVRIVDGAADGFIPWASNLYDDALVVTGVGDGHDHRHGHGHRMIAFGLDAPGVEVLPVTGLLALDGSRSGAIRLTDLPAASQHALDAAFDEFVAAVRPPFLAMQTALCLGLASASLAAIGEPAGLARSLGPEVDAARAELARLAGLLDLVTAALDHGEHPVVRPLVQLRLDVAHLTTRATQLELAVRGGSAYAATSATARRVREALFLPVQSPTEVQLQWELRHQS